VHVHVQVVEYGFTLSRTAVPAGPLVLQFVNRGQDEHNLNATSAEGSPAGALPNTASGSIRNLRLELRAGSYILFCSLPEHEQKGMRATLTVY
jgi:plastocyanin